MPLQKLVKLLVIAVALGFPAAQAGADDYGIAGSGHPVKRVGVQGADDYGIAYAPGKVSPQGADDYGIA